MFASVVLPSSFRRTFTRLLRQRLAHCPHRTRSIADLRSCLQNLPTAPFTAVQQHQHQYSAHSNDAVCVECGLVFGAAASFLMGKASGGNKGKRKPWESDRDPRFTGKSYNIQPSQVQL